jgi:HK97 family phage portal protein
MSKPHFRMRGGQWSVELRGVDAIQKALVPPTRAAAEFAWFPYGGSAGEWEPGGWQRNLGGVGEESAMRFSAVYRCIALICGDISKLRPMLMEKQRDGTRREVKDRQSSFVRILRKPNHFQTWGQFAKDWQRSKQTSGNTYVLKERDDANRVRALYILDPAAVRVYVSNTTGEVFYGLGKDALAQINDGSVVVPASEIMHDRSICFWHPLIGVPPLYAAAAAALQGKNIQVDSSTFFQNRSMPSGIITAPTAINDDQAAKVKQRWQEGFSGANRGKVAVLPNGLEYKPLIVNPVDAQLVEQLGWTVGDVARAFGVPPYKLGLQTNVTFSNAVQLNQDYYSQCLQDPIFDMQDILGEGLELPADYCIWLNLDDLLIMDPAGRAEADAKEIGAAILSPNEARARRNLPPAKGGESPMAQQQNYSLAALAKRDAQENPFGTASPPEPPAADPPADDENAKQLAELRAKFEALAKSIGDQQQARDEMLELIDRLNRSAADVS